VLLVRNHNHPGFCKAKATPSEKTGGETKKDGLYKYSNQKNLLLTKNSPPTLPRLSATVTRSRIE